ncbi:uncharacterized protein N7496_007545 [Penicillium cataractarum]|uniref:Uncharacterized protein n=1 Tax=Penicillium cataractarum TaxID=2100454 RepID=A0A9W9V765_9EURO|nr:uncharacterized protein N7496_007545 [Penicillium cataractarum]KAJ5371453.1 hypothetical protein N7496_007545 [Penicillium cataractarum]
MPQDLPIKDSPARVEVLNLQRSNETTNLSWITIAGPQSRPMVPDVPGGRSVPEPWPVPYAVLQALCRACIKLLPCEWCNLLAGLKLTPQRD